LISPFAGMLGKFPPETVRLKVPFSIKPWAASEDIIGNLLMVPPDTFSPFETMSGYEKLYNFRHSSFCKKVLPFLR
jgi:hypothetical protein